MAISDSLRKIFADAILATLKETSEKAKFAIPYLHSNRKKCFADIYPPIQNFISKKTFDNKSKKKQREEVFYTEPGKGRVIKYKDKQTKKVVQEYTEMYTWKRQTAEFTKQMVAFGFYSTLESHCQNAGLDFFLKEENGYDILIKNKEMINHFVDPYLVDFLLALEGKAGEQNGPNFATGNNHSTVKVGALLVIQYTLDEYTNEFTEVFAAFIDMNSAVDPNTKWYSESKTNNNGFSTLKIALADYGIITPIIGKLDRADKYVYMVKEKINA